MLTRDSTTLKQTHHLSHFYPLNIPTGSVNDQHSVFSEYWNVMVEIHIIDLGKNRRVLRQFLNNQTKIKLCKVVLK